jgi:hypothetical protein
LATPHHGPAVALDGIGRLGRRNIVAGSPAINDGAGGIARTAPYNRGLPQARIAHYNPDCTVGRRIVVAGLRGFTL